MRACVLHRSAQAAALEDERLAAVVVPGEVAVGRLPSALYVRRRRAVGQRHVGRRAAVRREVCPRRLLLVDDDTRVVRPGVAQNERAASSAVSASSKNRDAWSA